MHTYEIWDRTSPINGVAAETVLARRDDIPKTGDVILVKDAGGRVVQFQPTDPETGGNVPITGKRTAVLGAALVEELNNPPVPEPTPEDLIVEYLAVKGTEGEPEALAKPEAAVSAERVQQT